MKSLVFSTGNSEKFHLAKQVCDLKEINLEQVELDIVEIQDENPESVAIDKAIKAFELIKRPVVITDDSWSFTGLNGFPGVYMHSMNKWFTPEDFIRLTKDLKNREAQLIQKLVYIDKTKQKVFTVITKGELLKEVRGVSKHPSHTVITIEGDNGLSIAEAYENNPDHSNRNPAKIWHEFVEWFKAQ